LTWLVWFYLDQIDVKILVKPGEKGLVALKRGLATSVSRVRWA
jgi:hypothetical protein